MGAVEGPLFVLLLGESSVSLLYATAAITPGLPLLQTAATTVTGFFQRPPGSFVGRTIAVVLSVLFASSLTQFFRLQALRSTFMSSESSENVATQAVTVEKLLSATHTAYLSGFNLLLLFMLRSYHELVSRQRRMDASAVAMKKQAEGLQAAYSQLMSEDTKTMTKKKAKGEASEGPSDDTVRSLEEEKKTLLGELAESKSRERSLKIDNEALIRQSQGQSESYKRLVDAHTSLREQMQEADEYMLIESKAGGKKDN